MKYRCQICSAVFESKAKPQKCPDCKAKKENLKPYKDPYEDTVKRLKKYDKGVPPRKPESCCDECS